MHCLVLVVNEKDTWIIFLLFLFVPLLLKCAVD